MTVARRFTFTTSLTALLLTALSVAACGGSGGATAAPPITTSRRATTVGVASTRLGRILVDSHGRTLYLFKLDSGGLSACTGACATAWPPLLAHGKPSVGSGASASLVASIQRANGTRQLTYNGHPLYTFVDDQKRGDLKGQGVSAFGARWYVLSPAGDQIAGRAPSSGAAATSSGGGGY
jgi:predicted lipoprotein with Yx(FWY)xxD motif